MAENSTPPTPPVRPPDVSVDADPKEFATLPDEVDSMLHETKDTPKQELEQVPKYTTDPGEPTKGLSDEDVAREVLAGKWGRGQESRVALEEAGYDPNKVRKALVKLLNT